MLSAPIPKFCIDIYSDIAGNSFNFPWGRVARGLPPFPEKTKEFIGFRGLGRDFAVAILTPNTSDAASL
jgi:hypothetical protein